MVLSNAIAYMSSFARGLHGIALTWVVKHDHNIVKRDVHVYLSIRRDLSEECLSYSPLSIPSAPSCIARSKLANVFSGKAAEACAHEARP